MLEGEKHKKMSENGEIYSAGKIFTLPPALTALTNFTSASVVFMRALKSSFFNKFFLLIFFFCNACCETNVGYCSLMSPSHPPRLPGKVLYLTLFYSFPSKWISCLHMYIYEYIHLLVFTCGQWECSSSIFLLTTSQILQQERGDGGQQGTLIIPAVRAICIHLIFFRN